jgi:HEAT repeat protein
VEQAGMNEISENIKILIDPLDHPSRRQQALDALARLGNLEAISAICERARDPLEHPAIRYRAVEYLRNKGIMY